MSALELALRNLASWSLQVAVLSLAAAALSRLLPIERPATRLALGQALLALALLLPLLQPWHAASAQVTWSVVPALSSGPAPSTPAASSDGAALWPPALAGLLMAGAALRLARLGRGLGRLRSLGRRARPLEPTAWVDGLRDEVAPRAVFRLSDEAAVPATFGAWRPVVLLPSAFTSLPRDQQQAIVLHELVHARRADWLFILLEELLTAVVFFHPAVHWLVGRIRLAREQTVDAAVVRRLGARQAYLDSLVETARCAARARAVPAAPFLRQSHLRERVDLLLREVLMSRLRTLVHVALTAVAILLAVSWAVSAVPLESAGLVPAAVAPDEPIETPTEPRVVHKVQPSYPAEAKAEGVQGLFIIEVVIGKDGAIKDARVVVSAPTAERLAELKPMKGTAGAIEGDARLADAALDAVRQWRYEPILKDGRPVDVKALVTVNFKLA